MGNEWLVKFRDSNPDKPVKLNVGEAQTTGEQLIEVLNTLAEQGKEPTAYEVVQFLQNGSGKTNSRG